MHCRTGPLPAYMSPYGLNTGDAVHRNNILIKSSWVKSLPREQCSLYQQSWDSFFPYHELELAIASQGFIGPSYG